MEGAASSPASYEARRSACGRRWVSQAPPAVPHRDRGHLRTSSGMRALSRR
jgi:hypothetical protein